MNNFVTVSPLLSKYNIKYHATPPKNKSPLQFLPFPEVIIDNVNVTLTPATMPRKRRPNRGLGIKRAKKKNDELEPRTTRSRTGGVLVEDQGDVLVEDQGDLEQLYMKGKAMPLIDDVQRATRIAIAIAFINAHNAEPDRDEWLGRDSNGIIAQLRRALGISENTKIRFILEDVLQCKEEGSVYTGDARLPEHNGKQPFIKLDSVEAQMAADCLESNMSLNITLLNVNKHREEIGADAYTMASIYRTCKALQPLYSRMKKVSQGSKDVAAPWSRARYNWVTQLLIRFGMMESVIDPIKGTIKDCFNSAKMDSLNICQIAWWDETHRKCVINGAGREIEFTIKFKRDADGKLDVKNGKYSDEETFELKVKFGQEIRLCLGCSVKAVKTDEGNTKVGVRLKPFDYSGKTILTIKDWNARTKDEIARVQNLSDKLGLWVIDPRKPGALYRNDVTSILNGCGPIMKAMLLAHGIETVGQLKEQTSATLQKICNIKQTRLEALHAQAQRCWDADAPDRVDYRLTPNPYLAKFGDKQWEERIAKTKNLSAYCCVTHMIHHIYEETRKCFVGTDYEKTFMFYHDALSLMTAKGTVEWMDKEGILEHWILPVNNLNSEPDLKAYRNRPPGNSPYFMPWDTSLNRDVHCAVDRHAVMTADLDDEKYPEKFSLSTPKRGSLAYHRILDPDTGGVPSSNRIVQDVEKVPKAFMAIWEVRGIKVDGLGNRKGVRHEKPEIETRGGCNPKQQGKDDKWWHEDIKASRNGIIEGSRQTHPGEGTGGNG